MSTQIDASFDRVDPQTQARVREAYQNAGSDPNGNPAVAQVVALAAGTAVADAAVEAVLGGTNGAAVTTDANGTAQQYLRGLVKLLAAATNSAGQRLVYPGANPQTPVAYRSGIATADVLAAPTCGSGSAVAGGSLIVSTSFNIKVVAVNAQGRTTAATCTATSSGTAGTQTIRQPITSLAGATNYDIYLSTDADPKWVGRIAEAQRASGIVINGVGTTTAGGAANSVDVQVAGTGLQSNTTAAVNTAYSVPNAAATTVNATSNAGQAVLGVAATANFSAGQQVLIGVGTARYELQTIASIQAGTSLTLAGNLLYQHTGGQADPVVQPNMVNTTGYDFIDFDVSYANNGDGAAAALVVTPFLLNSRQGLFMAGTPAAVSLGGVAGNYAARLERVHIETRACPGVALLVQSIAGTTATVGMDYVLD